MLSEVLCVLEVLLLELLDLSVQEKVPLSPAFRVGGVVKPGDAEFPLKMLLTLGFPLQLKTTQCNRALGYGSRLGRWDVLT